MSTTSIEWTDEVWNPVVGCTRVSEGCRHCYAERMSGRLAAMALADKRRDADIHAGGRKSYYLDVVKGGNNDQPRGEWNNKIRCVVEALGDPLRWRKPRRVFVNSMSDLFHPGVPDDFICRVWNVMRQCRRHVFQILTKRPDRMADLVPRMRFDHTGAGRTYLTSDPDNRHDGYPLAAGHLGATGMTNVWLGTSVEDQAAADERIPHLLRCPAAVRFLSMEPLLGAVDLLGVDSGGFGGPKGHRIDCIRKGYWSEGCGFVNHSDLHGEFGPLDWVIVGGESGPGARAVHLDWVRSIRDQCVAAGVPFFFKQWGDWLPSHPYVRNGDIVFRSDGVIVGRHEECVPTGLRLTEDGAMSSAPGVAAPNAAGYVGSGQCCNSIIRRSHARDDRLGSEVSMSRVGKKLAGRELDGRTWDEMPLSGAGGAG